MEVCSACHPFFTGKIKLLDMAGRVEKFQKKSATAATAQAENQGPFGSQGRSRSR